jgi:HEAT repeat protein
MASEPWTEYDAKLTRGAVRAAIEDAESEGNSEALIELLESPWVQDHALWRRQIVDALGRLRDQPSLEALERIGRSDDIVRVRALAILADTGDRAFVPTFIAVLEGDDRQAQIRAIWGLSKSRANEAVAPLIAALRDPSPSIRAAAAAALANIGDPIAIPPLREAKRRAWRPWRRYGLWIELKLLGEMYPDR